MKAGAMLGWHDLVRMIGDTLRQNRLRTGLTMAGIVWGVALSLTLAGLGDSVGDTFIAELERSGQDAVLVWPGRAGNGAGGYRAGRDLRFDDRTLTVLRAHCPSLERLSPQVWVGFARTKFRQRVRAFPVSGVEPSMHEIMALGPAAGRTLDETDVRLARKVCFIGANVRARLFGSADPVGRTLRIEGRSFRVVGVGETKGADRFRSGWQDDDLILIPSTTARRLFVASRHYPLLILQARSRAASYTLVGEVRRVLGPALGFDPSDPDALTILNTVERVAEFVATKDAALAFAQVVTLTTLLIGGIGLTSILVISVNERTREIGLRRAIGATRLGLIAQFLGESTVVTLAAGTIGVLLAVGIRLGMAVLPLPAMLTPPVLPPWRIVGAFGFMVAVGVLAGIVPARRAARLDPAEALRHE